MASREHLEKIGSVVEKALSDAGVTMNEIDALAVTRGPGLIGSLLVGLCYAKSVAFALDKPFIGVHHIEGHVYSTAFEHPPVEYPATAFIISGGHTNLFWIPEEGRYLRLGHARDDAAGEAYDKVAKLLGLGYPGGPVLDRLAKTGDARNAPLVFRPPNIPDGRYDFSFSGLKTAVLRFVRETGTDPVPSGGDVPAIVRDLAASFQQAVVTTLVKTLKRSMRDFPPRTILLGGGVACNSALRTAIRNLGNESRIPVYLPSPQYTTDNAAMIAAAGFARLHRGERSDLSLTAEATLKLHTEDINPPSAQKSKPFRTT